ncbi:hypothetical protein Ancab_026371, partial [Ancistrocladus abbreviatus]
MRILYLVDNNFHGLIPQWIWNTTEIIALAHNHFTGELPSLANQSMPQDLGMLWLSGNMLNGSIPSWLFALPSIAVLALGGNQFTGKISPEILSNSLRSISLDHNNLSGIVELDMFAKLKNLIFLSLS